MGWNVETGKQWNVWPAIPIAANTNKLAEKSTVIVEQ